MTDLFAGSVVRMEGGTQGGAETGAAEPDEPQDAYDGDATRRLLDDVTADLDAVAARLEALTGR